MVLLSDEMLNVISNKTDGSQKADQVFLPVLENAAKAAKLRTTLGIFERSKFFFNLPNFIAESVEVVRPFVALYFGSLC